MVTFKAYCERCSFEEESESYQRAKDLQQGHAETTGHHVESFVEEQ